MEQTITSEPKERGRNSFSALMKKFNVTKPADDYDTNPIVPKSIKAQTKNMITSENVNLTDPHFEQSDSEIPAAHSKTRDVEIIPEKETPSKEVTNTGQSENNLSTKDSNEEPEQKESAAESAIKRIPIETALDDLHSMDADSNQSASQIVVPEQSPIKSDEAEKVTEPTDTILESTPQEAHEVLSSSTQVETLQDQCSLQEPQPAPNEQTSGPQGGNNATKVKISMLQKKHPSSAMSLREKQQSSSKSSQSSLYSSGPSSSSMCHLTELSQPKPEALRTTLMCLRQLHGKDAKHLVNIERHLRGLRAGPKTKSHQNTNSANNTTRHRTSKSARTETKTPNAECETALGVRQALEKFAANLFAELERKRALENYEVSRLQMPVEIGYYRAAYDALVTTFGQPYHKCTLELYQQLAGELGLGAEMFVMDTTPKITNVQA